VKVFQAATSEMYGVKSVSDKLLTEESNMEPVSPYALSKLACYHICKYYRASFNLDIRQAISFNHESPFRNELFVTRKITFHVAKYGDSKLLKLGNVDAVRDWGHAKDFVKAYHLIMDGESCIEGEDVYVVSTG
jgi:GDPmannose 4,6-dehydratase